MNGAAWWEVAVLLLVALMAWFSFNAGRWVRSRGADVSEGTGRRGRIGYDLWWLREQTGRRVAQNERRGARVVQLNPMPL